MLRKNYLFAFITLTLFAIFIHLLSGEKANEEYSSNEQTHEQIEAIDHSMNTRNHELSETDFIMVNNRIYESISSVISDVNNVGDVIGEVQANVLEEMNNPEYIIKEWDASFLDVGTKIFVVQGYHEILAVQQEGSINNYRLYQDSTMSNSIFELESMDIDYIQRIEVYRIPDNNNNEPILSNKISEKEGMSEFINLLKDAESTDDVVPEVSRPTFYKIVFYTNDVLAETISVSFDNSKWIWNGQKIPEEVEGFIVSDN